MFKINKIDFVGIEVIQLLNTVSGEYVSIIPSHGGNLHELVLQKENILFDIIYTNKSKEELLGTYANFYRGAKLSPFPNRIEQGTYTFENTVYTLPQNDKGIHALHGLLWNKPFNVNETQHSFDAAKLILIYSYKKESAGYPFSYDIRITYLLNIDGLTVSTQVLNTSDVSIPLADGWHPYLTTGIEINQLQLKIPATKRIETNESLIPTGNTIEDRTFETASYIGNRVMDSCFIVNTEDDIAETILVDEDQNLSIVLWQEKNVYPYVHIYTPPDRMSIAIEPCSCIPNAFESKDSLDILQPGEERVYRFGVRVR